LLDEDYEGSEDGGSTATDDEAKTAATHRECAANICRVLLDRGADATCRDKEGNTAMHWAGRAGHGEVLRLLLMRNCPLDAQNQAGETALHWAVRAGLRGRSAVRVLVENGARVNVFDRSFKRPLDVAAEGFGGRGETDDEDDGEDVRKKAAKRQRVDGGDLANGSSGNNNDDDPAFAYDPPLTDDDAAREERKLSRWNLLKHSSQCRTLVLHHPECLDHAAKSEHDWEVPDRIKSIISTLSHRTTDVGGPGSDNVLTFKPYEVTVSEEFERASLELLSRIHSAEYLAFVNELSKELERRRKVRLVEESRRASTGSGAAGENDSSNSKGRTFDPSVVPFTPMVQKSMMKDMVAKKGHPLGHIVQCRISKGSETRRGCGAARSRLCSCGTEPKRVLRRPTPRSSRRNKRTSVRLRIVRLLYL